MMPAGLLACKQLLSFCAQDGFADQLRDLDLDGVSDGTNSVHRSG